MCGGVFNLHVKVLFTVPAEYRNVMFYCRIKNPALPDFLFYAKKHPGRVFVF